MNLDRVTITGADNSVKQSDLLELTREFPFVEWGILVSASRTHAIDGSPRFPSKAWIARLQDLAAEHKELRLSLHVCGKWVRDLLIGKTSDMPHWLSGPQFPRWQLNFHAEVMPINAEAFREALMMMCEGKQVIFQIDGHLGQQYAADADSEKGSPYEVVPLFDGSHGAGVLPGEWPRPFDLDTYHGYAGGLGPENLSDQLPRIAHAAGEARFWVDMETKVRSEADQKFDLAKVRRCLEIARDFMAFEPMKS